MDAPGTKMSRGELQERIDAHPVWYHTIDIEAGVTTPGCFDLRPVLDVMPWPDVKGMRCLDVGTFDGFLAFEMERRGASEVIAIDIDDPLDVDWPPDYRDKDLPRTDAESSIPRGAGFRLAAELMGSKVKRLPLSVYDIDVKELGKFDVVVMGSLLLHLRDPIRALESVRTVTDGYFLSSDQIEVGLTLMHRRRPVYQLNGSGSSCQWFNFNAAGHERLLYAAGFGIERRSRPYVVRFNVHPKVPTSLRVQLRSAAVRCLTGGSQPGVLHQALLARPRV